MLPGLYLGIAVLGDSFFSCSADCSHRDSENRVWYEIMQRFGGRRTLRMSLNFVHDLGNLEAQDLIQPKGLFLGPE